MGEVIIREARAVDLPAMVGMLASDDKGGHGDSAAAELMPRYRAAFDTIAANPAVTLFVAERDGSVVGMFQATVTTVLAGRGERLMTIEGVQTRADCRGQGVGAAMMAYAEHHAKTLDCARLSLQSNAERQDAHRFYTRLGFAQTHLGFKKTLS